jgi:phospholipid/cholesterol/gamma-HCH transport system substrate-binding protein
MDKKVANNVIVGVFVTSAFIGFVWVLFTMGGGTGLLSSQYSLLGTFSHVKGLHPGSEVSLSGLRIGTIKTITVANDDTKSLVVELAINKDMKDKIREDSVASIKTQGMLGDKYVEVSIGVIGEPLQHNAHIKTEEPPDLFAKSGNLVEGISRQFSKGGDFEQVLKNIAILSQNLADITASIKRDKGLLHEMIYGNGKNFQNSISHLESILAKIDRGDGTIGSLINDPTVYEDMKSMTGGAKRSTILRYFMRQFIESGEKDKKEEKK